MSSAFAVDRSSLRTLSYLRVLQLALGAIWLVDAGLQYQSYMFSRAFVTQTLEPAAAGNPYIVEHPALWADHLMLHHIAMYNAIFATIQLLIAVAIFFRPTVRLGLAASMVWGLAVWWLAEGIGGISDNASPVTGAPGAVLLYVVIAALVWPRHDHESAPSMGSVAEGGPLGRHLPRLAWVALWVGFILLGLERANRSPSALHDAIAGMADGEPSWVASMDHGIASALAHHGLEVSIALAVLYGIIAVGGLLLPLRRPAVILAVIIGLATWVAEDFGQVLTGQATDVNTGLLLILFGLCFWPVAAGASAGRAASA